MLKKLLITACLALPIFSIAHASDVKIPELYSYKITDKNKTFSVSMVTYIGASMPLQITNGDKNNIVKKDCVIKENNLVSKGTYSVSNSYEGKEIFVSLSPYLYDKDKNAVQTLLVVSESNTKVDGKPIVVSDTCTINNSTTTIKSKTLFKRLNLNEKTELKMPDGNDIYVTVEKAN